MILFRLLPLAGLLLAIPAAAQTAADPEPVQVGNWSVQAFGSDACQAITYFGDHLTVSITEDADNNGHLILLDDRWQLKTGGAAAGTISWDEAKDTRNISFLEKQMKEGDWALVADTGPWFTDNLAGAKHFTLEVPDVQFNSNFNIPETMDVLKALVICKLKR